MDKYSTRSLAEASYLQAKGQRIIGKEKQGDKMLVVFPKSKEVERIIMEYYNGGKVEAKLLFDNFRSIKEFIFMS